MSVENDKKMAAQVAAEVAELMGELPAGTGFVFVLFDTTMTRPGDGWAVYSASAVSYAYQAAILRLLAVELEEGRARMVGSKGQA